MDVPVEFGQLCLAFHQDCFDIHGTVGNIVADVLSDFAAEEKQRLADFLVDCLENRTPSELMELWNSQDTDILIRSPAGALRFWKDVAAAVESVARSS